MRSVHSRDISHTLAQLSMTILGPERFVTGPFEAVSTHGYQYGDSRSTVACNSAAFQSIRVKASADLPLSRDQKVKP
jgi:hypothetical protein